jgi:hypothetical protein
MAFKFSTCTQENRASLIRPGACAHMGSDPGLCRQLTIASHFLNKNPQGLAHVHLVCLSLRVQNVECLSFIIKRPQDSPCRSGLFSVTCRQNATIFAYSILGALY